MARRPLRVPFGLGVALLMVALACGPRVAEYNVDGRLEGVLEDGRVLLIAHEEIPGYMQPMTMKFDVHDPATTPQLAVGDPIRFTLVVEGGATYIRDVVRR